MIWENKEEKKSGIFQQIWYLSNKNRCRIRKEYIQIGYKSVIISCIVQYGATHKNTQLPVVVTICILHIFSKYDAFDALNER